MNTIKEKHISVLLNELVKSIEIFKNKKNIIVDCTLGMGGHASKIIKKMNTGDIFIGFDTDMRNLKLAKQRLQEENDTNNITLIFIHSNFVNLKNKLAEKGITKVTGIYYDLGLSSLHIDEAERGFSFRTNGPLDMRFDANNGKPASFIVNSYNKQQLISIFKNYGEENQAEKIAKIICETRKRNPFQTTQDLVNTIETISKHPKVKTRIFQALRIETNKELEYTEKSICDAINILSSEGYIFIISFHSLEDRLVKKIFKKESRDCICDNLICSCHHKKTLKILSKKPILPSVEEIKNNSRSRSAKARYAKKI